MRTLSAALLAFAACIVCAPAAGQAPATVEGVQMPAWVERNGERRPLAPGMALRSGDELRTGAGSRILLRLAEGSLVKLGENGTLRLAELAPGRDLFRGALGVLEGAFRFTTQTLGVHRRRDINIHVSQVTAGIRGTDVWGRSRAETQIVCLIEGEVEVSAPNEAPITLNQPLQFYQRERGQARPIGSVDPAQLAEWARETEIEAGRGAARRGGRFSAELAAVDDQGEALAVYDRARDAGYAAEIQPVRDGERIRYIVRIGGLPTRAEATALAAQLKGRF